MLSAADLLVPPDMVVPPEKREHLAMCPKCEKDGVETRLNLTEDTQARILEIPRQEWMCVCEVHGEFRNPFSSP